MFALILLNAVVSFLLEITLFIVFSWVGYHSASHPWLRWTLALALPALLTICWGRWAAPKSKHRLRQPWLILFEIGLTLLAAGLLWYHGQFNVAVVLFGAAIFKVCMVVIFGHTPLTTSKPSHANSQRRHQ